MANILVFHRTHTYIDIQNHLFKYIINITEAINRRYTLVNYNNNTKPTLFQTY